MLTLQQLINPPTEDEVLATILATLQQLGFEATSWQDGAIQLTILRTVAKLLAALGGTIQTVAAGGFTVLAGSGEIAGTSAFLKLLALYVYNITPGEATATVGQVLLTSIPAAPLYTIAVGDLVVSDQPSGTAGANTYTNTTGGTLAPGSTLSLEFKADSAGQDANIATGTTLYLWSPLAGVDASCPAYLSLGTWITTPGSDEESDASLVAKCIGQWSQLTYGNINGAYEVWARKALPALTRVSVQSAAGDGTVVLVGATALGPLTAPQCTTILEYIDGTTDGVGRRPLNDIVSVIPATTLSLPALTIEAYVTSDVIDSIASDMSAALLAYIGTIPIGGTKLTIPSVGVVLFEELGAIAQRMTGVRKAMLSISADIPLGATEIYTPTITVNVHPVQPGV
jgi:uncharacterized phage protein gp47/JayE